MRTTISLTAALALALGAASLAAQENDAEDDTADTAETFAPSEEVAADTAVAFPTDI